MDNEAWIRQPELVARFMTTSPEAPPCDLPIIYAGGTSTWSEFERRGFNGDASLITGLLDTSSQYSWLHPSHWTRDSFYEKYGNYMVQSSNKRYDDGFEIDTMMSVGEFMQNARNTNRSAVATAYNTDLERALLRDLPYPPALKDFDLRPVVQISAATGSGTHLHNHGETWLLLLHGMKAWWIAASNPPSAEVELERTSHTVHPCSWLESGGLKGMHFCVQRAGDLMYIPDGLFHATCNIHDFVLGVGSQGRTPEDWPALSKFVHRNQLDDVKALVQGNVIDVNAKLTHADPNINYAHAPLQKAALKNFTTMVKFLIGQRADCDTEIEEGPQRIRPLHWAACNGHTPVANLLLKGRADVDASLSDGTGPLPLAIVSGDLSLVKLLLAYRADMHKHNAAGEESIHFAAQGGYVRAVDLLVEKRSEVHLQDKQGQTPFFKAAKHDRIDVLKFLLKESVDPLQPDVRGQTPLHAAAARGHQAIVRFLGSLRPSSLQAIDCIGYEPIHYAIQTGRLDLVDHLLYLSNRSINSLLADGAAPLHLAVHNGILKTVAGIVHRRADVSMQDGQHGIQPMEVAEMAGHREIVDFLVRKRASVSKRSLVPESGAEAASQGHLQMLEFLFKHGLLKPNDIASFVQERKEVDGQRSGVDGRGEIPVADLSIVTSSSLLTLSSCSIIAGFVVTLGAVFWGIGLVVIIINNPRSLTSVSEPLLYTSKVRTVE